MISKADSFLFKNKNEFDFTFLNGSLDPSGGFFPTLAKRLNQVVKKPLYFLTTDVMQACKRLVWTGGEKLNYIIYFT